MLIELHGVCHKQIAEQPGRLPLRNEMIMAYKFEQLGGVFRGKGIKVTLPDGDVRFVSKREYDKKRDMIAKFEEGIATYEQIYQEKEENSQK